MLIAVPSDAPGGLDAPISEHFGQSDVFTLVQVVDGAAGEVKVVPNAAHEEGGCLGPVRLLKEQGVEVLVAGGMGARPLSGFQDAGIAVHSTEGAATVGEAVSAFLAGACREFGAQHACGGHDGCGGHHHHHAPVQREVVAGPIEKDRVVFVSFQVRSAGGEVLDDVERLGYLHGHGQMIPGLEHALAGHLAGDQVSVTLAPEEAFGPRDESLRMTVPLARLPEGIAVGDTVAARSPHGEMVLTVLTIEGAEATVDANHPLAGQTLTFDARVLEVQAATADDLAVHEHGCC
jgi:FKBP-type peptidyl-prolyl cis-trans isomerase 2/predicted Fe-Mo cluster-binding NifX family protein